MIYLLKSKFKPTVLIGTADEIAPLRACLERSPLVQHRSAGAPWLFRGLSGWRMAEGTEGDAEALRGRFPQAFPVDLDNGVRVAWNTDSPELREWAERNTLPWDGSEARRLGVAPLGRRHAEARESSLSERVRSRKSAG